MHTFDMNWNDLTHIRESLTSGKNIQETQGEYGWQSDCKTLGWEWFHWCCDCCDENFQEHWWSSCSSPLPALCTSHTWLGRDPGVVPAPTRACRSACWQGPALGQRDGPWRWGMKCKEWSKRCATCMVKAWWTVQHGLEIIDDIW